MMNSSHIPTTFLLMGLPGLEDIYCWISVPICFIFTISMAGNSLILYVICCDYKLHQPMFLLLSLLAITDILVLLSTCHSVLGIFVFQQHDIFSQVCLLQIFCIHVSSIMESSLLVTMAFDRFVAICHPLRYPTIVTNSAVLKIFFISIIRGTFMHIPTVTTLQLLPYCKGNVLSHQYCLHQDVMNLACDGTNTFNIMFGFFIICNYCVDLFLIVISYVLIIRAVLHITSKTEQSKLFNTCVSHLCAVCIFYIPLISSSLVRRINIRVSLVVLNLLSNAYLFLPPVLNPIIYSIKMGQIYESFRQHFNPKMVASMK